MKAIAKRVFVVVVILTGSLMYCSRQMSQANDIGRAWCVEKIDEQKAGTSQATTSQSTKTIESNEKPASLYTAMFTHSSDGGYECTYTVAGGLFPRTHTYKSKTGAWESYD